MRAAHFGFVLSWVSSAMGLGCQPEVRPAIAAPSEVSSSQSKPDVAPHVVPSSDPSDVASPHDAPKDVPPPAPYSESGDASPVVAPMGSSRGGIARLDAFYAKLDRLTQGKETTPLRVLWLGDSHTAADFMTHPLRRRLQEVGGNGGPGFIRLGLDQYRHGSARVEKVGKWRHQPIQPSQRTRVLDGVFGYGGIRTIPTAGALAKVTLRDLAPETKVRFTVAVRLGTGDAVEVKVGGERRRLRGPKSSAEGRLFLTESFETTAATSFSIQHFAGSPEVFGLFAETVLPGVVFDTAGINGARVATPLAWDAESYEAAVAERAPDLFVLAYGTNEAFDNTSIERYPDQYRELMARLRRASPNASCWVVGPPDSATKAGTSISRVAPITEAERSVAEELGCAFSSLRAFMGGDASFDTWMRASPPRARGDRVHLTILGYEELGAQLAEALLPRNPAPTEAPTALK